MITAHVERPSRARRRLRILYICHISLRLSLCIGLPGTGTYTHTHFSFLKSEPESLTIRPQRSASRRRGPWHKKLTAADREASRLLLSWTFQLQLSNTETGSLLARQALQSRSVPVFASYSSGARR